MSKVFVMSESVKDKHNVDGLAAHGEIVFLYKRNEKLPSAYNPSEFASSISSRLSDNEFDPDNDFIALVGKQIELAMIFYTVGLLVGNVRMLFFDAAKVAYAPVRIDADAIPDIATA